MSRILSNIGITVNKKSFKKDPLSTDLGIRILRNGVDLLDELGFEEFTFRKLAKKIQSTEASIYRYFENKHNLLAYVVMWYWGWVDYQVVMAMQNVECPEVRLKKATIILTKIIEEDIGFEQVNEIKLNSIVIKESSKLYLCNQVDDDNEHGFFSPYKEVVHRIATVILEIRPEYKYPHMLVSTVIEGAHHQRFFAEHLPRLTDVIKGEDAVTNFYVHLVQNELEIQN